MIARMRAGAFAPTDEPTPAVCFGCPAAARLCPHPAWRPRAAPVGPRDEGEPPAGPMVAPTADREPAQGTLFE
jgi:hypothetical protein